jgi:hypothetical protein
MRPRNARTLERIMSTDNRPTIVARNTSAMAGIDKHITGPVTIGGVTYTPATLKQVFSDENAAILPPRRCTRS